MDEYHNPGAVTETFNIDKVLDGYSDSLQLQRDL